MSTVAGSFGYLAPEYSCTQRVNEKIDVYSFRVILLELTTVKEANDAADDVCLVEWAWWHVQENNPIVDALNPDVRDESNLREMVSVFKLRDILQGEIPFDEAEVAEYLIKCREQVCPNGKNP